ncbi:glycosyltransferase [Modestobacter sp. VKM Ac-2986]|uniref:glycosyltransferase family 2 protein n=1 Tax=Modestobacter sp. VKM Ac-2986 TaxID=3004140 RepID=UPI0022AB928D|nr:glycosyltransferase [Modestobacter sp. VKM Ac-2986]MCZ2830865.1 glycosyltransferase [Modestobacter sp. VKM Ac-2986]
MAPPPTVTAVVPTHDRLGLLLRTLESVRAQTEVGMAVVVVDDGGSDGTTAALRELDLPGVRVLRHERSKGVSAARNAGLALVTTPYTAFVDDDDLWAPTKTADQLAAMAATAGARWSCSGALHVDRALDVVTYHAPPPSGRVDDALLEMNVVPGGGSGLLVETALAREVGGFDETISILADWDFDLRLALASPVASVDRPLVGYFVHPDSMFHDPLGVMRELTHLARVHGRLPDGRSFAADRAWWYSSMWSMARGLGDRRAAAQLAREAFTTLPPGTSLRMTRDKVRGRLTRRTAPVAPALPPVADGWLDRFRDTVGEERSTPTR